MHFLKVMNFFLSGALIIAIEADDDISTLVLEKNVIFHSSRFCICQVFHGNVQTGKKEDSSEE